MSTASESSTSSQEPDQGPILWAPQKAAYDLAIAGRNPWDIMMQNGDIIKPRGVFEEKAFILNQHSQATQTQVTSHDQGRPIVRTIKNHAASTLGDVFYISNVSCDVDTFTDKLNDIAAFVPNLRDLQNTGSEKILIAYVLLIIQTVFSRQRRINGTDALSKRVTALTALALELTGNLNAHAIYHADLLTRFQAGTVTQVTLDNDIRVYQLVKEVKADIDNNLYITLRLLPPQNANELVRSVAGLESYMTYPSLREFDFVRWDGTLPMDVFNCAWKHGTQLPPPTFRAIFSKDKMTMAGHPLPKDCGKDVREILEKAELQVVLSEYWLIYELLWSVVLHQVHEGISEAKNALAEYNPAFPAWQLITDEMLSFPLNKWANRDRMAEFNNSLLGELHAIGVHSQYDPKDVRKILDELRQTDVSRWGEEEDSAADAFTD